MLSVKMEKKNASKCVAEAPIATKPITSCRDRSRKGEKRDICSMTHEIGDRREGRRQND
jgi:hypothetical protein